jgi:hypothetical protein
MKQFRSARWLLLALLLCLIPASSSAGVFISVGFAPPMLPVYEQPVCPEPGLMWTPGYWAYGPDGYYWVPGAWVPAPYEGALWTPPYWGWSNGLFMFHDGYWGNHVGYYGGVNYGFGYMGIGFVGGMWRGHDFLYNTAVMRVDGSRFRNTYEDRAIVDRYTVARGSRVAFSGGAGGIQHLASPEERMAMRDQHIAKTSFQAQHESAARSDRNSYFKSNGGRPSTLAVPRPLGAETHAAPGGMRQGQQPGAFNNRPGANPGTGMQNRQQPGPAYQNQQNRPAQQPNGQYQQRNNPSQPTQQARPAPQQQQRPMAQQQQPRPAPQPQARPAAQPQSRPAPKQQAAPKPQPKENEHK